MPVELKVPPVGESISQVVIGEWLVQPGQQVAQDSVVVVLETDKINVDVPAPVSGTVTKHMLKAGESAGIGAVLALIEEGAAPAQSAPAQPAKTSAPAAPQPQAQKNVKDPLPAAKRAMAQAGVSADQIQGSGKDGQILKEDVPTSKPAAQPAAAPQEAVATPAPGGRQEETVTLSPLRQTIARRLVESQQTAALLTTFNEIDMTATQELRKQYQEGFTAKHGTKLGFMSFFVKATIEALKAWPTVNAEIRGNQVIYKNYFDIGVAVGGGKGLVVPVLRNAERMSFADIEKQIKDFGVRAQAGKIKLEELQGGTFTISNGGVYGSLLSTPIVNPPQSGVLGLHKIEDRPVALNGQVVIRPMMYIALTYDHRLVDGREAVSFLVRIKECMENPSRILLEV
jgi:2-oxoglutarate dehydrogenase E2 component (dihydrolipoamide succinyltransferase)